MNKRDINVFDLIGIQECINLYGGEHGTQKNVLEKREYIQRGHVEFSFGYYDGKAMLTFKGSDGTSDWIDNFRFWKTEEKIATFMAKIHTGFESQWDFIFPWVEKVLKGTDELMFFGHSLGGALAVRAGLHYIGQKKFSVITYGAPRVMNLVAANYFNKNVAVAKRFTYSDDIVPHVPTAFMNFTHTKSHIALGKTSFWGALNVKHDANDHRPTLYMGEIEKALPKGA